jgi:hypothetical protein
MRSLSVLNGFIREVDVMRRVLLWVLIAILALPSAGLAVAQDSTPAATPEGGESLLAAMGYPELRVATDGSTNDFPTEVEAGRYHVVLENQSDALDIDLEFYQLPEGVTLDDVMAFFEEAETSGDFSLPDYFFDIVFNGGPNTFVGETSGAVLDLPPGEWIVNVYTYNPETDESIDTPVTVTVTGEMPELDAPMADVTIEMVDMDFVVPDSFSTGPQVWQVTSSGMQIHHLILSRVPDGTTEDQVIELAGSFMAPPASPEAEASPVLQPASLSFEDVEEVFYTLPFSQGQYNLYEVDLEPGTYAMICFLPDPEGTPHVLLGMVEIIIVEE